MKFLFMMVLSVVALSGVHSLEVQGHRGARGSFPENTLPAFAAAIEAGVDTLELDLHITLDGEIVIHHDYFIHEGRWDCQDEDILFPETLIRSMELSEIKKVDVGSKTNPKFPKQQSLSDTQIPTLDELFVMMDNLEHPNAKEVRLNLEVKRDPRYPELSIDVEEFASKVVAKVREYGFSDRVYYSSFDPEILMTIYELDPQAELGFIFSEESLVLARKLYPENPMGLLLKIVQSFNGKTLSPQYRLLTDPEMVDLLHKLEFRVVPWTVNDSEDWTRLIEMGVDGLITDYPEDLLQFLAEKK